MVVNGEKLLLVDIHGCQRLLIVAAVIILVDVLVVVVDTS